MLTLTNKNVRTAIMKHGERLKCAKGDVLFSAGERSDGVYLVARGAVQTSHAGALPTAKAGSLLGVLATINGPAYSISAVVSDDSELIYISRVQLIELMDANPTVSFAIIDLLGIELREIRERLKAC